MVCSDLNVIVVTTSREKRWCSPCSKSTQGSNRLLLDVSLELGHARTARACKLWITARLLKRSADLSHSAAYRYLITLLHAAIKSS